jgi:hypothetical protein
VGENFVVETILKPPEFIGVRIRGAFQSCSFLCSSFLSMTVIIVPNPAKEID